jgi:hypothetical protein
LIIITAHIKAEIMINQINDRLLISNVLNNHIILINMNNSFLKILKPKNNNIYGIIGMNVLNIDKKILSIFIDLLFDLWGKKS